MSDISEADSDDIAGLLGDVDKLDADLFGPSLIPSGASSQKKPAAAAKKVTFAAAEKPALTKQERVGSEQVSDTTKNTQEATSKSSSAVSTLDDILGFGPPKTAISDDVKVPAPAQQQTKSTDSSVASNLDDLFGPAPRRSTPAPPGRAQSTAPKKKATDWLGIGGNDSDEENGSAFQDLLSKRKKEAPARQPQRPPEPPATLQQQERPTPAPLPFLEPKTVEQKPQVAKKVEAAAVVKEERRSAPEPAPLPVQRVEVLDDVVERQQKTINRLKEENEKLEKALEEQRNSQWDEKQQLLKEMKSRVSSVEMAAEDELRAVKESHRNALKRLQEDNEENLERLKRTMAQEAEAALSVFEQKKNYEEVVNRVDTALDQLSSLSGKVVGIHSDDQLAKEVQLKEREAHVQRLQERLDKELSEIKFEKEKVHKLLEQLEITVKDQENSVETQQRQLQDKVAKFEIEKSYFEESKRELLAKVDNGRMQVQQQKDEFLMEQKLFLEKVLSEQERIQQERLSFQIQKDSDLQKMQQQALLLDARLKDAEEAKARAEIVVEEYHSKHRKLLELEQSLKDEAVEIHSRKFRVERDEEAAQIRANELAIREAELLALRNDASKLSLSEERKWEAAKSDIERRHILLKEKAVEIIEKQKEIVVQQENILSERENLERKKLELQHHQRCPNCQNESLDDVPEHQEIASGNFTPFQAAEKPFDSPLFSRKGSMRSRLKKHTKDLDRFLKTERSFLQSLD